MDTSLSVIDSIGKANHKIIAITETGYEGVPDSTWWTGTLLPAMEKYPVAYVLVWRNAREKVTHFFGPYPGQASAEDFKKFFEIRKHCSPPISTYINNIIHKPDKSRHIQL